MAKLAEQVKIKNGATKNIYIKKLEKKALFLKELLSFVEDKALGFLMEDVEQEKNISLAEAKKLLK